MKLIPQSIPEILLIQPQLHGDERGYFTETFRQDILEEYTGKNFNFVQDNESKSSKGILRGLHYQLNPYSQSKLLQSRTKSKKRLIMSGSPRPLGDTFFPNIYTITRFELRT